MLCHICCCPLTLALMRSYCRDPFNIFFIITTPMNFILLKPMNTWPNSPKDVHWQFGLNCLYDPCTNCLNLYLNNKSTYISIVFRLVLYSISNIARWNKGGWLIALFAYSRIIDIFLSCKFLPIFIPNPSPDESDQRTPFPFRITRWKQILRLISWETKPFFFFNVSSNKMLGVIR